MSGISLSSLGSDGTCGGGRIGSAEDVGGGGDDLGVVDILEEFED